MNTEFIEELRRQAEQLANGNHKGWGNTMSDAADKIAALESDKAALVEALEKIADRNSSLGDAELQIRHGAMAVIMRLCARNALKAVKS